MDPKSAREMLEALIDDIDNGRIPRRRAGGFLRRIVRPAGLGLALSLGALGIGAGCGEEDPVQKDGIVVGADSAYGLPDFVPGEGIGGEPLPADLPPTGDLYGIPQDIVPPADLYGVPNDIPPPGDLYGVLDGPPPATDIVSPGDLYGVVDGGPPKA